MNRTEAPPLPPSPSPLTLGHVLVPLGALLSVTPWASPGLGLLGGVGVALLGGNPYLRRTRRAVHTLLAVAVTGLGAGMDLREVLWVGAHGALTTVVGIAGCLALGLLLARVLGVKGKTGLLISIGTAICGGSAIAAVVPVLAPEEHEVSAALGTVFLLNALALFVFPAVGHAVGLSPEQFGLWSALAIHDTSSVVGAAVAYGGGAVGVATAVKLARALWIVPLTFGLGLWHRRERSGAARRAPWFLLGFLAAAGLVTWVPALRPWGQGVASAAKHLMTLTLFLVGTGLTGSTVRAVGPRPLLHGSLLWLGVGSVSLGAIVLGLVG